MMPEICKADNCTGCGLCADVCPKGAVRMEPDGVMGHLLPRVDGQKCVDCGLCSKKCPANRTADFRQPAACYAAWCQNEAVRRGSSSGGAAAALYRQALRDGYWVTGTELTPEFQARMKVTNTEADLKGFHGSKYIQAECGGVYRRAQQVLKSGGRVLFVGTPCQCAAMRSMAEAEAEQLATVELICHGVPSQKVFLEYVNGIAARKHRKLTHVSFRSDYGVELTLRENAQVFWQFTGREDAFLVGFQKGLLHRQSCYHCPYARPERASDLTIGDFWGIDSAVNARRPKGCKVSVVLANTSKGAELLADCQQLHLEERPYAEALSGNTNLNHPSEEHPQRAEFLRILSQDGTVKALEGTIDTQLRRKRLRTQTKRLVRQTAKRMLPKKLLEIRKNRNKA